MQMDARGMRPLPCSDCRVDPEEMVQAMQQLLTSNADAFLEVRMHLDGQLLGESGR